MGVFWGWMNEGSGWGMMGKVESLDGTIQLPVPPLKNTMRKHAHGGTMSSVPTPRILCP